MTTTETTGRAGLFDQDWALGCLEDASWMRDLPAVARLLLTTDGTMTTVLSACHGEPVDVELLGQHVLALPVADVELGLEAGEAILVRHVLLRTRWSARPVAYGRSRVAIGRLSAEMHRALLDGRDPIGLVLRREKLETFRALLGVGLGPPSPEAASRLGSGPMCSKTYVVIAGGDPLMVVGEEFPAMHGQELRDCA